MRKKKDVIPVFCLFCDQMIPKPRGTQLYCTVNCKNNYHSRLRSQIRALGHEDVGEIVRLLKQNYYVLLSYALEDGTRVEVLRSEMRKKGFNPNFMTTFRNLGTKIVYCCFDCCWEELDEEFYSVYRGEFAMNTSETIITFKPSHNRF